MGWMPNDTTVARWDTLKANTKLGRWPKAESARIDARFRMLHVEGTPNPIASRYVVRIFPFTASTVDFFAIIDLAYVPASDHLFGTSGVNVDGREVTLTVTQYDPGTDPIFGDRGIMFDFTYQKDGGGISHAYFMWSVDIFGDNNVPYRPFSLGVTPNWLRASLGPVAPTDWTELPVHNGFHWITMSDCYVLEEQAPPAPLDDFIAGNGTDAYVQNDQFHNMFHSSFKFSAQVRWRSLTNAILLCSSTDVADVLGIFGTDLLFNGVTIPLSPVPGLGVFGEFIFERARTPPGEIFRVFWEGTEIGTSTAVFPELNWDRMAGNRPTVPVQWGDLDMQDVLWSQGLPPSDFIGFDMDCAVAACDVGPQAIKGTTHNMPLPSCP